MGTAELLTQLHVPYRVITERQEEYSGLKVLFLNQALYLNENECARIRQFVQEGGTLIATGASSLYDVQGITTGDFSLADVLAVHYSGENSPSITYTGDELVSADGTVPLVTADADTQVKAILTFPDFPVNDPEHYASIHSNPPGLEHSSSPAFTVHPYGRGKCVWLAAPLLRIRQYSQQEYLRRGTLQVERLGRGYAWLDTGTYDSMLDAGNFIRTIETRQGLQVACLQEIAWENGWMTPEEIRASCADMLKTTYGQYLMRLIEK